MYNVSIPMALVDFIPVVFFGVSMIVLQRDLYSRMTRGAYTLFSSGTNFIFAAGFLKALWKLLYAANICDFHVLNVMMMPLQSIGFILAGMGLILALTGKKTALLTVAPPVFSGSAVFIVMMVLGLGAICTCLSVLAVKMKKKYLTVVFALSFLAYMGMGAMASQDATQAWVNWVEESINCAGQALLMGGVLILHKAGLADFDWRK